MQHLIFYVLLLCTSILWAGNFVAGKFLVDHASSLTLTTIRWGIALLFLIPIVWKIERRLLPPKKALLPLFYMGLTGVVLFNVFMFLALERTSADNTGLLSALNPVAIAVASFLILNERLSYRQLIGMFISFCGVVAVLSHGNIYRLIEFRFNTGDLFMLAAVGSWGLYSVAGKKAMLYASPFLSTLWAGVFGLLILLPFNLPSFTVVNPDISFWIATFYVSVGATVLAMLFWNFGVQKVGGTKSGMFLNFNPIFTALLAFLFIGERMTAVQMVGTAIVITGVYLFTTGNSNQTTNRNRQTPAALGEK